MLYFEKLTPVQNAELGMYEDAINYAIEDKDICNVAISGSYSAGKSSILSTYKENHADKSFLHISLTHFEDGKDEDINLEGKVLNQLIHKISEDNIPRTNFKIKKDVKASRISWAIAQVMTVFIIVAYFVFFAEWSEIAQNLPCIDLSFTLTALFRLAMVIIAVVQIFFIVRKFFIAHSGEKMFKRVAFHGNEIELFGESESSYFDKYLNEVVYLFSNSNADIIVFEDMDRFNDVNIFERLREINELVNSKRKKENIKPIKFFYLIRDDIFNTKDRTKFFDFIIPIIPVVDGSNSYPVLIKILRNNDKLNGLDPQFLKGISLFIDDMRLLKNICNEFLVFSNKLNTPELNPDKLLAIITYKNIFPRDYSELQIGKGYIFNVFENKDNVIQDRKEEIRERLCEIDELVSKIDGENLNDSEEIACVMYYKYYRGRGYTVPSGSFVKWIQDTGDKSIIEEMNNRIELLESKTNNKKETLFDERKRLHKELKELSEKHLKDLFINENQKQIFDIAPQNANGTGNSFADVKGNDYYPLLKYLVRNGYIDETYSDYMTYFYDGGIKREDKLFLRSVAENISREWAYHIKNPHQVIDNLRLIDFSQIEILNYDLFRCVLINNQYSEQRDAIIKQIASNGNCDFIEGFLENNTDMYDICTKYVSNIWQDSFICMKNSAAISETFLWKWSLALLCNASNDSLVKINKEGMFSEYLANCRRIIDVNYLENESFCVATNLINLKIADMTIYTDSKSLNRIVSNDFYHLTVRNVSHICNVLYNESIEEYYDKPYTKVCEKQNTQVLEYVKNNIDSFVESIITECDKVKDEYVDVVCLLNNAEVTEENKKQYIHKLQTVIISLSDIAAFSLWPELLIYRLVQRSDENIVTYFEQNGLDDTLVEYINSFDQAISLTDYENDALFDAVIKRDDINLEKYEQILVSMGLVETNFSVPSIESNQMNVLVKNRIIEMNSNNLSYIRENYKEILSIFILENYHSYLECIVGEKLEEQEIYIILDELLGQEKIDESEAIDFLEKVTQPIEIGERIYPDVVMIEILNNHLYESDRINLFSKYENYSEKVKDHVLKIAKNRGALEISQHENISDELIKDYVLSDDIDAEDKECMLIVAINQLPENVLKALLKGTNYSTYCKLFDVNSRPRIPISNTNNSILDAFRKKGYIADFSEDDKGEFYRIKKARKRQMDRD